MLLHLQTVDIFWLQSITTIKLTSAKAN